MDEKLSRKVARLGGVLLAWAACCGPVVASDSTMEFVTATDSASDDGAAAQMAEASDLVIHVADEEPNVTLASASDAMSAQHAHGDLTVVANGGQRGPVSALIVDDQVAPAAHTDRLSWSSVFGSGPRRPSAAAGIQGGGRSQSNPTPRRTNARPAASAAVVPSVVNAPFAYDMEDAAPQAVNARHDVAVATLPNPATPARQAAPANTKTPASVTRLKSPQDHAKELLVSAYQLSLTASNEAEYSQIVQWCASAMRGRLDEQSRQFGASLSAWALNRRGQSRADEGELDLALADFRAALEYDPNNVRALHNRAVTYAQLGQFAEAFDDLCHVVQLKPDFAKAYSNRATLYVQAGDFEKALADYESALKNDPKLLPALVGRGRVCHIHGKLDEALKCFDAALAIEPKDAEIVCSRADLLADLGRYEDALTDYAQAIDLNSKFEHAYRNGAWLLATCPDDKIRDAEGALAGAQAALDCGYGERHAALDTMAAALANAGKFPEAVGTLQQAIEIAPAETRAAYEARLQLYESKQPFRTHPVGAAASAASSAAATQSAGESDEEEAVYIEE